MRQVNPLVQKAKMMRLWEKATSGPLWIIIQRYSGLALDE